MSTNWDSVSKKTVHAKERDRKDVVENWKEMQRKSDICSFLFLDESGVNTNMSRIYTRSFGGQRANDSVQLNTGKSTTILLSIRMNGQTVFKTYSGAINGERFIEYLKKLILTLVSGDIVVMDNLRVQKVAGVRELH